MTVTLLITPRDDDMTVECTNCGKPSNKNIVLTVSEILDISDE